MSLLVLEFIKSSHRLQVESISIDFLNEFSSVGYLNRIQLLPVSALECSQDVKPSPLGPACRSCGSTTALDTVSTT